MIRVSSYITLFHISNFFFHHCCAHREAIAAENSSAFYPLLTKLSTDESLRSNSSDIKYYETAINFSIENNYITKDQIDFISLSLALHKHSAKIQALYQYHDTVALTPTTKECPVWLQYDKKSSCDSDTVFALETKKGINSNENDLILPFDRVHGTNSNAQIVILYADITNPKFAVFHQHLLASASNGKIRYILRYRKPVGFSSDTSQQPLAGFGVELYIKRTDYLVIDDRDIKGAESTEELSSSEVKESFQLKAATEGATIKKNRINALGYRMANYIMSSEDKFGALVNSSLNFPKYSYSISELPPHSKMKTELEQSALRPGNSLYINGAIVSPLKDDIFSITDLLDKERQMLNAFKELGISPEKAISFLTNDLADKDNKLGREKKANENDTDSDEESEAEEEEGKEDTGYDFEFIRYDYRSPGLIWLNDLANDQRYMSWSSSLNLYKTPTYALYPAPVSKNIHTVVFIFNPNNKNHLQSMAEIFYLLERNVPAQVAIVPVTSSKNSEEIARELYAIYHSGHANNKMAVLRYIGNVLSGVDHKVVFKALTGLEDSSHVPKELDISNYLKEANEMAKRLDINALEENVPPTVIVNGVIVSSENSWLRNVFDIIKTDVQYVRKLLFNGQLNDAALEKAEVKDIILESAEKTRKSIISPSDKSSLVYSNMQEIYDSFWVTSSDSTSRVATFVHDRLPQNTENPALVSTIWIFGRAHTKEFLREVLEALKFLQNSKTATRINVVPFTPKTGLSKQQQTVAKKVSNILHFLSIKKAQHDVSLEIVSTLFESLYGSLSPDEQRVTEMENMVRSSIDNPTKFFDHNFEYVSELKTPNFQNIKNHDVAIVLAGRVLTPKNQNDLLNEQDFQSLQSFEFQTRLRNIIAMAQKLQLEQIKNVEGDHPSFNFVDKLTSLVSKAKFSSSSKATGAESSKRSEIGTWELPHSSFEIGSSKQDSYLHIVAVIDPISERGQVYTSYLQTLSKIPHIWIKVILNPPMKLGSIPLNRFYRSCVPNAPSYDAAGNLDNKSGVVTLSDMPQSTLMSMDLDVPSAWIAMPKISVHDLDNIILDKLARDEHSLTATYELKYILLEGHATDVTLQKAPRGVALTLGSKVNPYITDTLVMENLGYFQLKAAPGLWHMDLKHGLSSKIFEIESNSDENGFVLENPKEIWITDLTGITVFPKLKRNPGMRKANVLGEGTGFATPKGSRRALIDNSEDTGEDDPFEVFKFKAKNIWGDVTSRISNVIDSFQGNNEQKVMPMAPKEEKPPADINIFSVASGHLYERFLSIMTLSVTEHTNHTVKFWIIENFLSPKFKQFLPYLAKQRGFDYEFVTYKWPHWLHHEQEKQRTIWGYKILFLDVLFPTSLNKIIFVDADQIVRTDMKELVDLDLHGAPYGFTPMCDSRKEIEGFRFWKQGYWKKYLGKLKYHISALYVVDLVRFRELAAGDLLRQHYQMLSADAGSLANLDQDLPNHLQKSLPIYSLPQDWLWCETWCSDESLLTAKTIDLCNNPMTKEPKLDRARRQVPEWTTYDNQVAEYNKNFESMLSEIEIRNVPDMVEDNMNDEEKEFSEAETVADEDEDNEEFIREHDEL